MKYFLIFSFLFLFVFSACKKEEKKAPLPASPTASLSPTEAALVGDWIWDSLTWINSSGTHITNSAASYGMAGAHMTLNSTLFDPAVDSVFTGAFVNGSIVNGWWAVAHQGSNEFLKNNYPSIGSAATPFQDGIITTLTPTSLVLNHGTINYVYLYYHK